MSASTVVLIGMLGFIFSTTLAQEYTHYPITPIYDVHNEIRKGETVLVFIYYAYCQRSMKTLPPIHEAANELLKYDIKVKSLEYDQTGFEFMKVLNPLPKFPGIVLYRSDGSKVTYDGVDPPHANAYDFVNFALYNQYPY